MSPLVAQDPHSLPDTLLIESTETLLTLAGRRPAAAPNAAGARLASARSSVTRPGIVEAMTAGEATQVLVTPSIHDLRRNLEAGEICTSTVDGVPINPQNVMNRLSGSARY